MSADDPGLLTMAEAAEMLRRPIKTLRHWRATNQGPKSFRLGTAVVYRRAEVLRFIEQQEQETARGGAA